jgi:hypothetical protein
MSVIMNLCQSNFGPTINIDHLAGDGNPVCRLKFRYSKVVDHDYKLDYAKTDTARHTLTISFESVTFHGLPEIS